METTLGMFLTLGLATSISYSHNTAIAQRNSLTNNFLCQRNLSLTDSKPSSQNPWTIAEGEENPEDDSGLEGLEGFDSGPGIRGLEEEKNIENDNINYETEEENESIREGTTGEGAENLDDGEDSEGTKTLKNE